MQNLHVKTQTSLYLVEMTRAFLTIYLLLVFLPTQAGTLEKMQLVNVYGKTERMSDYLGQGKWTIANIWSPSCSACITELPQIIKFIERNPDIPVIGITLDFPSFGYGKREVLREFLQKKPLNYPLFLADIKQVSALIGRWLVGIPSITIFHPDGRPLVTWPGVVEIEQIEKYIKNYKEVVDPLTDGF